MNHFRTSVLCFLLSLASTCLFAQDRDYVIVVHGGAGAMASLKDAPDKAAEYYAALDTALTIGDKILSDGGDGSAAVIAVISFFEGNPLFNAGIGATVTADGKFELDASIMEGNDLSAGAVAGVKHVKHPIQAAWAVKTRSPHVMLSGDGADAFARSVGLDMVEDNMYFSTPKTLKWIDEIKKSKNGTVGCVVMDRKGHLFAGTSTGGTFKKQWGRIGDSPVIGAGTYADDQSCAVSCTGHGEYFIRHAVAFDVCARYKYLKESVADAADYIIHKELSPKAGNGGLIAVDRKGNIAMSFNSEGMFRGYVYKDKGSDVKVKKVGILDQMK